MIPAYETLLLFFLIFARISAFIIASPFFSVQNFPNKLKAGFALCLSIIIVPTVTVPEMEYNYALEFILALIKEIGVGLALGFICTLIFSSFLVAGQLIDIKIGFFVSQVFDPMAGGQVTIISRFLFLLGLAFLLAIDAHHDLVALLVRSFFLLPPDQAVVSGQFALVFIEAFSDMMILAVKIAAPIIAVVLAVDISLGMIGRTAPQMNIFMMGFPLKIFVGILTLSIMIPLMGVIFNKIFSLMEQDMLLILKGLT